MLLIFNQELDVEPDLFRVKYEQNSFSGELEFMYEVVELGEWSLEV